MLEQHCFEDVLKSLRVRRGKVWTQKKMAQLLEVSLRTYVGWENGESLPSNKDLQLIANTFRLSETEAMGCSKPG